MLLSIPWLLNIGNNKQKTLMWGPYNKVINKNKLLYYCIVCIDILWVHLLHIRITKMVLYSIYQTHMLQNTQGSKEWGKHPLTARAGPEFVMFCHILSLNLPYKDESVFNISSLNSANIHFRYWNTGLQSDALEDSFCNWLLLILFSHLHIVKPL